MKSRLYGLLLIVAALVAAIPSFAQQSGESISANTPTPITLNGTTPFELTYTAAGAETITVIARSLEQAGVLDPTVEVLDPNGVRLAFNDDHGSSRAGLEDYDSLIEALELPGAGSYVIRVTTFSGAGAGRVEVTVETGATPIDTNQGNETPAGQTISDVLNPNSTYTHSFDAQAGQTLTITVRATTADLDPSVTLVDANGAVIAENDDHDDPDPALGASDSRIRAAAIPADGTYTIQITGFAGTGGTFDLTIEGIAEVAGSTPTPQIVNNPTPEFVSTPATDLSAPLVLRGEVASNQSYGETFEAQAGDVFVLSAHATGFFFDPRVSIFNSVGNLLVSNDDHGGSDTTLNTLDARIDNYIIPATGTYMAVVDGVDDSGGAFELTIQRVASGAPLAESDNQVLTGDVQPNGSYVYTLSAQAGDYVTITARGVLGALDPRVTLLDGTGSRLIDNDDHGMLDSALNSTDAQIENYHIPASGNYTIEVTGYEGTTGTFTLTISTRR